MGKDNQSLKCIRVYSDRNAILNKIGFKSYQNYLDSDLWKSIRNLFLKDNPYCYGCGEKADTVHHSSYTKKNLIGVDFQFLYPVCNNCHHKSEFNGKIKLFPKQATSKLKEIRKTNNLPIVKNKFKIIQKKPIEQILESPITTNIYGVSINDMVIYKKGKNEVTGIIKEIRLNRNGKKYMFLVNGIWISRNMLKTIPQIKNRTVEEILELTKAKSEPFF
jgi:hypothetical protein